jgi:hypothetical protein
MNKSAFAAHGASVLIACCLFLILYLAPLQIAREEPWRLANRVALGLFAALGALTGFWLMAQRRGESESVLLAASTIVAILLLLLALVSSVQLL